MSTSRGELPQVEGTMPEDYLPGLKPIMQAAMKQAPQMITSEIAIVSAEANRISANAQFYPNLGGTIQYTKGKSSTSGGSSVDDQGLLYNIGFSQTIWQWGAVKHQSEIAKIGLLISEKSYGEAYRLLAASLRAQYLALIVKKTTLAGALYRVKISETALEHEEERLKSGAIAQGEIISPRLTLAEAKLAVERAELDYSTSRHLFSRMAGQADIADGDIPSTVVKPIYSKETAASLMALLRRDNAEGTNLAQIDAWNVRQADLNYQIARVRLLPKVYANAGATQSNSTSVLPGAIATPSTPRAPDTVSTSKVNSQSLSIIASWTLFDGFATRAAKMTALAGKRAAERVLQNQILLTLDTAQNMQQSLDISARGLDLTEQRAELAKAAMDHVKDELKLGNSSQTALDDTTAGYLTYQVVLATVRADFLTKWADYVSLVGIDPAMKYLPARYGR